MSSSSDSSPIGSPTRGSLISSPARSISSVSAESTPIRPHRTTHTHATHSTADRRNDRSSVAGASSYGGLYASSPYSPSPSASIRLRSSITPAIPISSSAADPDLDDLLRELPASTTAASMRIRISSLRERLQASEASAAAYAQQCNEKEEKIAQLREINKEQYLQLKDAQAHIDFLTQLRLMSPDDRARLDASSQPGHEPSRFFSASGHYELDALRGRALEQNHMKMVELEQQLHAHVQEIHRLQHAVQMGELERASMVSSQRSELERLRTEVERLEVSHRTTSNQQSRTIESRTENVSELHAQVDELRRQLEKSHSELESARSEAKSADGTLAQTLLALQTSETNLHNLHDQFDEQVAAYEELQSEYAQFKQQIEDADALNDDADGKHTTLHKLRTQYEQELESLRGAHSVELSSLRTELGLFEEKVRFLSNHVQPQIARDIEMRLSRPTSTVNTPARPQKGHAVASSPTHAPQAVEQSPAKPTYQLHNDSDRDLFDDDSVASVPAVVPIVSPALPSRRREWLDLAASETMSIDPGVEELNDQIHSLQEQVEQLQQANKVLTRSMEMKQEQEREIEEEEDGEDEYVSSPSQSPSGSLDLTRSNPISRLPAARRRSDFWRKEVLTEGEGRCDNPSHASLMQQIVDFQAEVKFLRQSAVELETCQTELEEAKQKIHQLNNKIETDTHENEAKLRSLSTLSTQSTGQQLSLLQSQLSLNEAELKNLRSEVAKLTSDLTREKELHADSVARFRELEEDFDALESDDLALRQRVEGRMITADELPGRRRTNKDGTPNWTHPTHRQAADEQVTRTNPEFANRLGTISQSGKLVSTLSEQNSSLTSELLEKNRLLRTTETQIDEMRSKLRHQAAEFKSEQARFAAELSDRMQQAAEQMQSEKEKHADQLKGVEAKVLLLQGAVDKSQHEVDKRDRQLRSMESQVASTQLRFEGVLQDMADLREGMTRKQRAWLLRQEILEFLFNKKSGVERMQLESTIADLNSEIARLKEEAMQAEKAHQKAIAFTKQLIVHPIASSLSVYVKSLSPSVHESLGQHDHLAIKVLDLLREKMIYKIDSAAGLKRRSEIDDMRILGLGFSEVDAAKKFVDLDAMAELPWSTLEVTLLQAWDLLLFQQFQSSEFAQEKMWLFLRKQVQKNAGRLLGADVDEEEISGHPTGEKDDWTSKSGTFNPLTRKANHHLAALKQSDASADAASDAGDDDGDSSFVSASEARSDTQQAEAELNHLRHHEAQLTQQLRDLTEQYEQLSADASAWRQREREMQAQLDSMQRAIDRNSTDQIQVSINAITASPTKAADAQPIAAAPSKAIKLLQEELARESDRLARVQQALAAKELQAADHQAQMAKEMARWKQREHDMQVQIDALERDIERRSALPVSSSAPAAAPSAAALRPAIDRSQQHALATKQLDAADHQAQLAKLTAAWNDRERAMQSQIDALEREVERRSIPTFSPATSTPPPNPTPVASTPSKALKLLQDELARESARFSRSQQSLAACEAALTTAQQEIDQLRRSAARLEQDLIDANEAMEILRRASESAEERYAKEMKRIAASHSPSHSIGHSAGATTRNTSAANAQSQADHVEPTSAVTKFYSTSSSQTLPAQLSNSVDARRLAVEDSDRDVALIADLRQRCSELESELASAASERDEWQNRFVDARRQSQDLQRQLAASLLAANNSVSARRRVDSGETSIEMLESSHRSDSNMTTSLALADEIDRTHRLQAEVDSLTRQRDQLQREVDRLQAKLEQLTRREEDDAEPNSHARTRHAHSQRSSSRTRSRPRAFSQPRQSLAPTPTPSAPPKVIPFPSIAELDASMMRIMSATDSRRRAHSADRGSDADLLPFRPSESAPTTATATATRAMHTQHYHHLTNNTNTPAPKALAAFNGNVQSMLTVNSVSQQQQQQQHSSSPHHTRERAMLNDLYSDLVRGDGHITKEHMHALTKSTSHPRSQLVSAPTDRLSVGTAIPGSAKIAEAFDDLFKAFAPITTTNNTHANDTAAHKPKGAAAIAAQQYMANVADRAEEKYPSVWPPPRASLHPATVTVPPTSLTGIGVGPISSVAVTGAQGEFVKFPFFPRGPIMAPYTHVSADPDRFSLHHKEEIALGLRGAYELQRKQEATKRREAKRMKEANAIQGASATPTPLKKGGVTSPKPRPYSYTPTSILRPTKIKSKSPNK